jgi:hypothetical protein
MTQSIFPARGIPVASVVVKDCRASMRAFARFFDIAEWRVAQFDSGTQTEGRYQDAPLAGSWTSARGGNGRVAFELVQPTGGKSIFSDHLDKRGEGLLGVQAAPFDMQSLTETVNAANRAGFSTLQSARLGENGCVWLDTRATLGMVTVIRAGTLADEKMENTSSEAAKSRPLPIQKHYHFGIVSDDRHARKAAYERCYGMDQWMEFDVESGTTMTDTTYYGQEVKHAYALWVGRRGGFAVELIQMRYGNSVYQEMRDTIGDGMHHVFPTICSPEEFAAAKIWFAEHDTPVIQSGSIAGLFDYFYVDGRRLLAGLTIEVITPLADNWLEVALPGAAAYVLIGPDPSEA